MNTEGPEMMWGNGSGNGMGWGMWLFMGVGTLVFWLVVLAMVRSVLPARGGQDQGPAQPDPLTLLTEGRARGELTVEEYEARRRHIVDGH